MAEEKQSYSSEFKAEVALKALDRNKKNLEPLSNEYNVPASLILTWAVQLEKNAAGVFETSTEPSGIEYEHEFVDLSIPTEELEEGLNQGVMSDDLNYARLASWTIIGLILVTVFMKMLVEIYNVETSLHPEQIAGEHAFYKVTHKKIEARKKLSSFGVVNKKENIYRVPVDMVIAQMAQDTAVTDTTKKDLLKKIDPTPVEK